MARSAVSGRVSVANRQLLRDMGTCLSFLRGSSQYVLLKSAFLLGGQTNATVSMWVKTTLAQLGGQANCLYGETATGNDIFKVEAVPTGNGKMRFTYRDDAGTLNQSTSTAIITTGRWMHIAVTKTGTAMAFYINGVLDSSPTLTATNTFTNSSPRVRLAGDTNDATAYFSGKMDEVLLYTRALAANEISDLFFTGITPNFSTNQVGWYKMDEGSGTSITDLSGTQSAGVITGAVYSTDVALKPRTLSSGRVLA